MCIIRPCVDSLKRFYLLLNVLYKRYPLNSEGSGVTGEVRAVLHCAHAIRGVFAHMQHFVCQCPPRIMKNVKCSKILWCCILNLKRKLVQKKLSFVWFCEMKKKIHHGFNSINIKTKVLIYCVIIEMPVRTAPAIKCSKPKKKSVN